MIVEDDPLDHEIRFREGERGKFYRPGMQLNTPVYLDTEIENYLNATAERRGVSLSALVNEILKNDIAIVEAVK